MGYEPSGARFNSFSLTDEGKPFNPFVNSGAIATCSLLGKNKDLSERFTLIQNYFSRLAGGTKIGFNNSVFLSERSTADRNRAIAYFLVRYVFLQCLICIRMKTKYFLLEQIWTKL